MTLVIQTMRYVWVNKNIFYFKIQILKRERKKERKKERRKKERNSFSDLEVWQQIRMV